ncbi:hypothetical protein M407DRAFT_245433 [Tulasnella calospora MUT 4182]|uniref:Uncharacterized protein n=1 Tax=Tulasnella calospora MUT 4182 TaxID=1051891 RepID=A0A0C3LJH3_9AGAM|nr:hypothetical protein M407DRAFT_245433 [Tulasnella calospora MUT 4182]
MTAVTIGDESIVGTIVTDPHASDIPRLETALGNVAGIRAINAPGLGNSATVEVVGMYMATRIIRTLGIGLQEVETTTGGRRMKHPSFLYAAPGGIETENATGNLLGWTTGRTQRHQVAKA